MTGTPNCLREAKRILTEKIEELEYVAGECWENGSMHAHTALCEAAVALRTERDELTAQIDAMDAVEQ